MTPVARRRLRLPTSQRSTAHARVERGRRFAHVPDVAGAILSEPVLGVFDELAGRLSGEDERRGVANHANLCSPHHARLRLDRHFDVLGTVVRHELAHPLGADGHRQKPVRDLRREIRRLDVGRIGLARSRTERAFPPPPPGLALRVLRATSRGPEAEAPSQ
jgi:hypothetical protein